MVYCVMCGGPVRRKSGVKNQMLLQTLREWDAPHLLINYYIIKPHIHTKPYSNPFSSVP